LDAVAIRAITDNIKEAARVRHDFHAALQISDTLDSIKQAFTPPILSPGRHPAERHLGAAPPWESFFAKSYRAEGKTLAGLGGEHVRLAREAKTYATQIRGNAKLGKLVSDNLNAFFPEIGYAAGSGSALRRLRKDDKSILQSFQPSGYEDSSTLIRLLLKHRPGTYYYW